jgi:hypothetical protein
MTSKSSWRWGGRRGVPWAVWGVDLVNLRNAEKTKGQGSSDLQDASGMRRVPERVRYLGTLVLAQPQLDRHTHCLFGVWTRMRGLSFFVKV